MTSAVLLNRLRFPTVVFGRQFSRRYAKKYTQFDVKDNKYKQVYRNLHGAIENESIAKDFVYALDKKERQLLMAELLKFETEHVKSEGNVHKTAVDLTREEKVALFLHHAVPFMVFGFMDNFIMIVCGEYIEFQFGSIFGFSTMAAAGMGNLVSDVIGIGSGAYVEKTMTNFGFCKAPKLTPEQADLPITKSISNWGRTVGIAIGCFAGMSPLLINWFKT